MEKLRGWLDGFVGLLWLSLLWVAATATVLLAPVAMCALVRTATSMQTGEADEGILRTFVGHIRELWRPATAVGAVWLLLVLVLVLDFALVRGLGAMSEPVLVGLIMVGIVVAGGTAFLPFVVARGRGVVATFRSAAMAAFGRPGGALQALLAVFVACFAVLTMPLLLLVVPALAAHIVAFIARKPDPRGRATSDASASSVHAHAD